MTAQISGRTGGLLIIDSRFHISDVVLVLEILNKFMDGFISNLGLIVQ